MNRIRSKTLATTLLLAAFLGRGISLHGAEPTNPVPQSPKPNIEEFRQQLKNLSPAEREAKLKEIREKFNKSSPDHELKEKRREELKNLSPEARQAKIREWRQEGTNAALHRSMTPEEREARAKGIRARLEKQLQELRDKKAKGPLTPEEQKRLDRMEDVAKRFQQAGGLRPAASPAQPADKPAVEK